jgi:auxin-responsive protein IAA
MDGLISSSIAMHGTQREILTRELLMRRAQVVGWPPVRSYRKSCFQQQQQQASSKAAPEDHSATAGALFVKVSMDGAPYLRKVDLKMYKGYRELREALEAMFICFSGGDAPAAVNPADFAVTYEDKDGDLMLVGDVPFE